MRFPVMATDNRARPTIPVALESSTGDRMLVDLLVDSGSDITLFLETITKTLGLDLSNLPEVAIRSPLGHAGTYRSAELTLELRRRPDVMRWTGLVGFVPMRLEYGLFGTIGFFEHFAFLYDARQGFLEITPSTRTVNLPTH